MIKSPIYSIQINSSRDPSRKAVKANSKPNTCYGSNDIATSRCQQIMRKGLRYVSDAWVHKQRNSMSSGGHFSGTCNHSTHELKREIKANAEDILRRRYRAHEGFNSPFARNDSRLSMQWSTAFWIPKSLKLSGSSTH